MKSNMATNKSCWRNIIHTHISEHVLHIPSKYFFFFALWFNNRVNLSFPWANIHVLYIKRSPPIFQNLPLPNLEAAHCVEQELCTVGVVNANGLHNPSTKEHNFHTLFNDVSSGTTCSCAPVKFWEIGEY